MFIEVALTKDITKNILVGDPRFVFVGSNSLQDLTKENHEVVKESEATTAIFYAIISTQPGLCKKKKLVY